MSFTDVIQSSKITAGRKRDKNVHYAISSYLFKGHYLSIYREITTKNTCEVRRLACNNCRWSRSLPPPKLTSRFLSAHFNRIFARVFPEDEDAKDIDLLYCHGKKHFAQNFTMDKTKQRCHSLLEMRQNKFT